MAETVAHTGGRKKGTPKTGGRQKGTPNKITTDVRELARQYAPEALAELAKLSTGAENENVRVAASNAILDRAWGKPAQAVEVTSDPDQITEAIGDMALARRVAFLLQTGADSSQYKTIQ